MKDVTGGKAGADMTDLRMRVKIEGPSKCEEIISSTGHHDLIVDAANDFLKRKRRRLQGTSAGAKRSPFTAERKETHSAGVKRLRIAGVEDIAVGMALERQQEIHAADVEEGPPGQLISLDSLGDLSEDDIFPMSTSHRPVGRGCGRGRGRFGHNKGRGYGPVAAEDDLCRHLIKLMEEEEELIDEPDAEEEMTDAAATSSKTQG